MDGLVDTFKALGDATRLRLVVSLAAGELSVGELAEILEVPQPRVSRHLAVLRRVELVGVRHVGTSSYHRLLGSGRQGWVLATLARAIGGGPSGRAEVDDATRQELDALRARARGVIAQRGSASRQFFAAVDAEAFAGIRVGAGPLVERQALDAILRRDLTLVDVGTGPGLLLPELAHSAREVIAVDPSERMLAAARARAADAGLDNVTFRQGEVEALPLDDGEVDGVVLNMVLHHCPDPERALAEIGRVLRPRGRLVLIDLYPHEEAWLREEQADLWPGFEPDVLVDWLAAAGVEVERVQSAAVATPRGELRAFVLQGRRRADAAVAVPTHYEREARA